MIDFSNIEWGIPKNVRNVVSGKSDPYAGKPVIVLYPTDPNSTRAVTKMELSNEAVAMLGFNFSSAQSMTFQGIQDPVMLVNSSNLNLDASLNIKVNGNHRLSNKALYEFLVAKFELDMSEEKVLVLQKLTGDVPDNFPPALTIVPPLAPGEEEPEPSEEEFQEMVESALQHEIVAGLLN